MASPDTVITKAPRGRSLEVEERQRRYLITMSIRTACFLAFLFVPGYWKIATLACAVVLPMVAVVLANAEDHRPEPPPELGDGEDPRALPPAEVVRGSVDPQ